MLSFLSLSFSTAKGVGAEKSPSHSDPLRSSIKLTKGKFGKALDAQSSPALIEGNLRFREPPLTVECWAKLKDKKNFNILVASDDKSSSLHWEIYSFAKSGNFSAYLPGVSPSEISSKKDICDNQWHYLAMQYDGQSIRLFVDGQQVTKQKVKPKADLGPQPGPLTIGMVLFGKNRLGCNGVIDDVRISNAIRPIKDIPRKPLILDPDTVGLWHFDSLAGFAADPAWTPRPAAGNVPAWEKETDKDWVDDRLRHMNTGNFFNATFAYPSWKGKVMIYRGTAIRLGNGGKGGVLFDRNQLRMAAWWTGDFLQHNNRRFGLLNTPTPAGKIRFTTNDGLGWVAEGKTNKNLGSAKGPLPTSLGKFHGLYRAGKRTYLSYSLGKTQVLDHPWMDEVKGMGYFSRLLEFRDLNKPLRLHVCDLPAIPKKSQVSILSRGHVLYVTGAKEASAVFLFNAKKSHLVCDASSIHLAVDPEAESLTLKLVLWKGPREKLLPFSHSLMMKKIVEQIPTLAKQNQPPQWTEPITTQGIVAKNDAPYVIDTLTVPYDNPYKALMFLSGLDFLPNGDIAVSTVHGDVWLVQGVDDKLDKLTWKRFATGMYQPMGLKVIDGQIYVLERGQLTRLEDTNNDGEADFYENFADQWHIDGGEHSFDTCLETDPQGNFYFFNTGDRSTPTGGWLLKASKDGRNVDIFCTGFRHPIGLGVSPKGVVTGADQEGNWMPSTRVDIYKQGGFYGDMRTHHQKKPPKIYDGPLCWLPRQMDNSAGGQVWITSDKFGPLSDQLLHLSYGRCRLMLLMPQEVDGVPQAGAVDLGLQFLSGIMRARMNPKEGHLYLCGMDGWQTAAIRDGCLQRLRYTGKKPALPISLAVHKEGIRITFSGPLSKKLAENINRYRIEQWNYRWSGTYGSKRWSVANPDKQGQDRLNIQSATLLPDGKSVFLQVANLQPLMQMQINYNLITENNQALQGVIYNTIHRLEDGSPGS